MAKRILGIDVGIASIGYALVEFDDENIETNDKNGRIIKSGVRTFERAEIPKTGESLAKPRREARLARRRNRRRTQRMYQIKQLFINYGLVNPNEIDSLYETANYKKDVWELRKDALERSLTKEEFARALTHIAKRRGFKSLRKTEEARSAGELLKGIEETKSKLKEGNFLTPGQMFASLYADGEAKRNKADSYKKSIQRELLEDEVKTIFARQRERSNPYANEELEQEYSKIAFYQRPIGSVENMVGKCTFEPSELRAPKQSYSAELFVALTKLHNLSLIDPINKENNRVLTGDEIKVVVKMCYEKNKVTYEQIRKEFNIPETTQFKGLKSSKPDKDPEKETFFEMKGYHAIRKAVEKVSKEEWELLKDDKDALNKIATAITFKKSDDAIREYLLSEGMSVKIVEALTQADISMSKVLHLSVKALDKIIPHMLDGFKYHDACTMAGYEFNKTLDTSKKGKKLRALTPDEVTVNPVVNRAVAQFRKVVNAIIREYGYFDQMNIEMARELSNSPEDRRKIENAQKDFKNQKDEAKTRCLENGINPDSGSNLLKFRLWEEQGGYCLYSGKYIEPVKLADMDYTDIDHIIPYSRSMDDSLNNKTLCLAEENRQKGNKIPYEYLGNNLDKWEEFVSRVNTARLKTVKKNRLLKLKFDEKDAEGFRDRNINDTRYIARFLKDYVLENLDFGDNSNQRVHVRSGSLTAFLRHQWGLNKNREESDRHHALDAVVVACATQGMVQYLSNISGIKEGKEWLKHQKPRFKEPWEGFRNDVLDELGKIFVSRAPRRKVTGQAHAETIRSAKHLEQGVSVLKTPLTKVKLKDLGKPDDTLGLHDKQSNWRLYEVLKKRLEEFNDDPQKAFGNPENPIYMPLSEEKINAGQKPHIIRSVKICTTQKSGLKVRNGIADNGQQARIDIFIKRNKKGKPEFYAVPIYVSDMVSDRLPSKAVIPLKPEEEWIEIDDTFEFQFSLFGNDLLAINKSGKPEDEIFGYYMQGSFNRWTGAIDLNAHDSSQKYIGKGIKTLAYIKKYQVDTLGNYSEVKKEKRIGNLKFKDVMENSNTEQSV